MLNISLTKKRENYKMKRVEIISTSVFDVRRGSSLNLYPVDEKKIMSFEGNAKMIN